MEGEENDVPLKWNGMGGLCRLSLWTVDNSATPDTKKNPKKGSENMNKKWWGFNCSEGGSRP